MPEVAILVFITTILAPFVQVTCMLYLLVPIRFGRIPAKLPQVLRFLHGLQPWSMMEVFMLGILVSIVKLAKMAHIIPGISLISFIALIFVTAAMTVSLDSHLLWEKWDQRR
jgi:paraquat-inducible protein A